MKNLFGHIGALVVVIIWGTTFVSSKLLLLAGLQPAEIFVIRFLFAYLCMLALSHSRIFAYNWRDELTFAGLGVMGGSLYFLTENMALQYSTTANVSILVSTCPLITAVLVSIFYADERMNRRQICGSVVAFIGTVLVIMNGQYNLHLNPLGDTLALSAALTWGFYSLLMRRIMGRYGSDFITRKVFFYGVLTILPYFMLFPMELSWSMFTPVVIGNLIFLAFVASTGGYLLWNWVMRKIGAVRSTNYIYLQSLVTMIAGAVILDERITLMGITGLVVLLVGMFFLMKRE